MKSIGIKLADGSFYPILEEGNVESKDLELTTVKDNQSKVVLDLYRSETDSMDDAEYVDSLEITNLNPHPNGEPNISLKLNLDENNELHAQLKDPETGRFSQTQVSLVTRTFEERTAPADFALNDSKSELLPGVEAVSTILNNANDTEFDFDFDPSADMSNLPNDSSEKDDDDITLDLNSLNFDGMVESSMESISDDESTTLDMSNLEYDTLSEATVDDNFLTDPQVIDDDIVSDKPLTDEDMLNPDTVVEEINEPIADNDGTIFSFEDETDKQIETPAEDGSEFDIPTTLLDPTLFDPVPSESTFVTDTEEIDNDIEPPTIDDLGLDDVDDDFDFESPIEAEKTVDEPVERDPVLDPIVENVSDLDDFESPNFDELDANFENEIDLPKISLENEDSNIEETVEPETPVEKEYEVAPDFDNLPVSDADIEPTFETDVDDDLNSDEIGDTEIDLTIPSPDFGETVTDSTNDVSDFDSLPDIEDALSGVGEVDLTDTREPEPEERIESDNGFDLSDMPDFGEDGFADTDSFVQDDYSKDNLDLPPLIDPNVLKLDDEDDLDSSDSTVEENAQGFDIDDMDLPDFDNLGATDETRLSNPSDLPDFGDPFGSLSNPTADTEFDYPEFDDSPAMMELSAERSSDTSDIFGDFDDTDAVFEGDVDGFVDPTAGKKKKNKKTSYGSYNEFSDEKENNSRKPIVLLLAALLACLVVILILVIQSKPKKPGNQLAQTNEGTKNSVVTSMGDPRNDAELRDVIKDTDLESSVSNSDAVENKSETVAAKTEDKKSETVVAKTDDKKTEPVVVENKDSSANTKTENKSDDKKSEEVTVKRPTVETATKVENKKTTVVIPAREDTIIIASKPETVVPLKKEVVASSGNDIKYTVVWGDTLWDISNAYYKTPYRYDRIAEYNGLSDANRIKSGQVILIPAE